MNQLPDLFVDVVDVVDVRILSVDVYSICLAP
jgi:hypothetical protein